MDALTKNSMWDTLILWKKLCDFSVLNRSFYFLVPEDRDKEKSNVDRVYRKLKRALNGDKIPQILRKRSGFKSQSFLNREQSRVRMSRILKAKRKRDEREFGFASTTKTTWGAVNL